MTLALILLPTIMFLGVFLWLNIKYKAIRSEYEGIKGNLMSFLLPPDELDEEGHAQPSPLALIWKQMAGVLKAELFSAVKGSMMGDESVMSRQEAILQRDVVQEKLDGNPVMQGLFGMLPKRWQNRIAKNPDFLGAAISLISKQGIAPSGNGHAELSSDFMDRVRRYGG